MISRKFRCSASSTASKVYLGKMPALAFSARSTGSKMRPRMTLSPGMRRVQHRVDGVAQRGVRQRGCHTAEQKLLRYH